jgi:hypothetical protein
MIYNIVFAPDAAEDIEYLKRKEPDTYRKYVF